MEYAAVIFWDAKNQVTILQKSKADNPYNDKQHYFGGKIKEGETPEMAIARELKEELNYVPKEIVLWKKFTYKVAEKDNKFFGQKVNVFMFTSPITGQLQKCEDLEGLGKIVIKISDALQMDGWGKGNLNILREFAKGFT